MTDELRLRYIESGLNDAIYNIDKIGITDKETKDKLMSMVTEVIESINELEVYEDLKEKHDNEK